MDAPWEYMAGLFDGEGSFTAQADSRFGANGRASIRFNPRMTMTLKHGPDVLDLYVEHIGGKAYEYRDGMHRWVCSKRADLLIGVAHLLPHLRIKHDIAIRFRELVEIIPTSQKGVNRYGGERSWTPDMVERAARIAFGLNPPGPSGRWVKGEDEVQRLVGLVS